MRLPVFPALCLALAAALCVPVSAWAEAADEPTAPGQVTGAKVASHPDWFKESFLDLPGDVEEAAEKDKHVILFMEMNGCPYCYKMLEESFKSGPTSETIREGFEVIALNVRGDREVAVDAETSLTEKALADDLGVRYTPTIVFLDLENRPVARVNGYRNPQDFAMVLDYVASKSYASQTLADYLEGRKKADGGYAFRGHPRIQAASDLSAFTAKPLALLFEDRACVACDALHDGHLSDPEVNEALSAFDLVRLDALSDDPITAPDGTSTTPRKLAADLGVTYRPALVLFDGGKEIARIDSMLYRYHFVGVLEYVGRGHYKDYPDNPFDYINAKTAELTAAGKAVSIADE
jgi:thioredoxin-related protein